MKKSLIISMVALGVLFAPKVLAQEGSLSLLATGKYFSVYGSRQLDVASLLSKINFTYLGNVDSFFGKKRSDSYSLLAQAMDDLYLEVSDILDIHVYSFHGKISILPDQKSLSSVFRSYFGSSFPERSFYLHPKNTIYISYQDLTGGMLGHEMAHAIISHYFAVPPPAKVQEVLCGYVEYTLLKKAKNRTP